MAQPFTKANAKLMAAKSVEARRKKRQQAAEIEQGLVDELGDRPITKMLLAILKGEPKIMEKMIRAQVDKALAGNTRAFNALVDRTDGPVKVAGPTGPQIVLNITRDPRTRPVRMGESDEEYQRKLTPQQREAWHRENEFEHQRPVLEGQIVSAPAQTSNGNPAPAPTRRMTPEEVEQQIARNRSTGR
jgi:hypothetical protein